MKKITYILPACLALLTTHVSASDNCGDGSIEYNEINEKVTIQIVGLEEKKEPVICSLEEINFVPYSDDYPRYSSFHYTCENGSELQYPFLRDKDKGSRVGFNQTLDNGRIFDGITYTDPSGNEFQLIYDRNRKMKETIVFSNDCLKREYTGTKFFAFSRDDLSDKELIFIWKTIYRGEPAPDLVF